MEIYVYTYIYIYMSVQPTVPDEKVAKTEGNCRSQQLARGGKVGRVLGLELGLQL